MKKLKLKEMIKSLALPVLLLVGLVFTSSNTVSAQAYKSAKEATVAVEAAFYNANGFAGANIVGSAKVQQVSGVSSLQHSVNAMFFGELRDALSSGASSETDSCEETFNMVSDEMTTKFANSTAAYKQMLIVAKAEALQIITE